MKKNSNPEDMRILIVEDDPDINTLLGKILVKAGFVPVQACSGTEAKLRIEAERFDLILLDLMLPGMNQANRNKDRFPPEFRFQLATGEAEVTFKVTICDLESNRQRPEVITRTSSSTDTA